MEIFGYSHKTMDDMGTGIVKQAMTASGSRPSRQSKIPFPRRMPSIGRGSFNSKRERDDVYESQRVAQRLRRGFTLTETEKRDRKKDDMVGVGGTLGRKYKPKFKTVKIGPRTARLRYVDHDAIDTTRCIYTAFNDVGPVDHFLRVLAEAIILHYSAEAGDYRVQPKFAYEGPAMETSDTSSSTFCTWNKMRFRYTKKGTVNDEAADDITHYNQSGNDTTSIATYESMVLSLAASLKSRGQAGYLLNSVTVFRGDTHQDGNETYSTIRDMPIVHDADAGRHTFEFTANCKFKIQNTTDADASSDVHDKHNIHANPLDGLVYRFRNRVPVLSPGWLTTLPQNIAEDFNAIMDCTTTYVPGVTKGVPFATSLPDQFAVPPPAPYTLFTNSTGRSKILIKPGEHRVLKLGETFNGSVNNFITRYVPQTVSSVNQVPPGGSCNMIALKPTFRTGTNEDLKVQLETDRYLCGLIRKRKLTSLPITNIMS